MPYKHFLLKIDANLFEQFRKACETQDVAEVMIKLIKKYIKDKRPINSSNKKSKISMEFIESEEFNKLSEIEKQIIFRKYIEDIQNRPI
jgi:hypothetical protein